jgi:hypothetical protein
MSRAALFALDIVAVTVLALGIYFPRYRRRDMIVAFISVNVGVLAVLTALTSASVSIGSGVGIGLFGVLSIIRLRSAELGLEETGYYFAALALGLLGGVELVDSWVSPSLSVLVLGAIYVSDHPRWFRDVRHQVLVLDRAFADESDLQRHLDQVLGGHVLRVMVRRLDLVNDTTTVDVRYRVGAPALVAS